MAGLSIVNAILCALMFALYFHPLSGSDLTPLEQGMTLFVAVFSGLFCITNAIDAVGTELVKAIKGGDSKSLKKKEKKGGMTTVP